MKFKRIISLLLCLCVMLSITNFSSVFSVHASEVSEIKVVYTSDIEAYSNELYYYIDSTNNYVYQETVDFENKVYLTDFSVDNIIVDDDYLYMSVDNILKKKQLNTDEIIDIVTVDSKITRFAIADGIIYFLSNNCIQKYDSNTYNIVVRKDSIKDFWINSDGTLSYIENDETINILDLNSGDTTITNNIISTLDDSKNDDEISLFSTSITSLRAKFPHGKYWNHADKPGKSNSVNNQNGYTDIPCPKHGIIYTDARTCNGFCPEKDQLSWQCMGYAEKIGYDITGYNPRSNANGWLTVNSKSALDTLKAGDIIRYKNDRHSIYVTGVNGNTITYTDCNSDGKCIIRWNAEISKTTISNSFSYVRVSPSVANDEKPILDTPIINLNYTAIGSFALNAENKINCVVGDTVTFGWSGIDNASTYQYAVVRLPVGHTPDPNNNSESKLGEMLKEGSGKDALSIPLTEAGVYKFAVGAISDSSNYDNSTWAKVYLNVIGGSNEGESAPTTGDEGVLTINATESSLASYPCQYTDVNGKLVSGNLQRIWPTTYSCDSSVLSWESWPGTACYQVAVRDLASNELVYEAYEYYDTKLEIGKLFRVDAPVRVWVAARDYYKKVLAQGTATYYMHKPTMEWTNPNEKEYYLINETIPVNVSATGLNKVVAYYKRSNETEWTKFGETNSSAGADINETINLDTTGMRKGTYRVRLEGYINDDMTPMTHTLDEFVLRTYPPEKTIKKLYLKFADGTTMVQNGDAKEVYTNESIPFTVIAQFEDGNETDISNEALTFECDDDISVSKADSGYTAKVTNGSTYSFDIIHDEKNYGCFNFSAKSLKNLSITGNSSRIHLREGASFEFEVTAEAEDKWDIEYEYPLTESELELTSADSSVASTKTTNEKCIITALKEGQTTVTIKYKTRTKVLDIYVYPKVNTNNLVSISCETGSSMTVFTGAEKMFDVYANYSDGTKEVISGISGLSASMSNTSVATVVVGGVGNGNVITGASAGTSTMTLSYGGKTCKVSVTVKEASTSDIKEIKLTGKDYDITIGNGATMYLDSDGGEVDCLDYYIKIYYNDSSYREIIYDSDETDSNKGVVLTSNNNNVKVFNPSSGNGVVRFSAQVNSGTSIVTAKYKGITQKYNVKIGDFTPVALSTTTELIGIKDTKAKFRTTISNGTSFGSLNPYPCLRLYDENGESLGRYEVNINTEFTTQNTVYEYWVEGLKPATMYEYEIFIGTSYIDDENSASIYFITNPNKTTEFVDLYIEESDVEIPVGTSKNIEVYAVYNDDTKKNITGHCDITKGSDYSTYFSVDDDYQDYFTITAKKETSRTIDISYNGKTIQLNLNITNPKLTSIKTGDASKTSSSITLNGSYMGAVSAPSEYGFIYSVDGVEKTVSLGSGSVGDKTFNKTISGLTGNTLYNFRSYAVVSGTYYYGETKAVVTDKGISLPASEVGEVENIDVYTASLKGNITSNGDGAISSYGFYYGTTNAASTKKVVGSNNITGEYSLELTGLQPNTKYYVKSFVVNQAGEYISNYTTFKTLPKEPEVLGITTNLSDSISLEVDEAKKIQLYANLDNDSTVGVPMNSSDFSFVSENENIATIVTEGSGGIISGVSEGSCKVTLTYKGYSKAVTVTVTAKTTIPAVTTKAANGIASTSANLNGSVSDNGNLDIIETGFYYYPKNNVSNKYQLICDTADTDFNYEVKGLLEKTDYYFYAYAVNEKGTSIGEKILFTTKDGNSLPNDIKLNASFLSVEIYNSQSLLATVLPENAINKDVVWKSQNDTIASVTQNGVVTGNNVGKTKILAITVANRIVASCDVEVTYPKDSDEYDFSEIHMATSMSELSKTGWDLPVSAGGNITMATAYLSRWDGAVLEDDAPYPLSENYVRLDNASAAKHVQNVYYLPPRQSATDNNDIKAAVMNYGAVSSSFRCDIQGTYFNSERSNYYIPENAVIPAGGHAVAIIGWDDNYSKENFKYTPDGDGAFLCKNSWGTESGDNGYFWISYYDATFAKGQEQVAVFIGAEDTDNYNKIYQYDPLGCVTTVSNNSNTVMVANAFMGGHNDEELKAVSFYTFEKGVNYEVYAVKDFFNKDSLVRIGEPLASGQLDYAGYHTVDLEKTISISANKKFAVIVKLTSKGKSVVALEKPIAYASNARANKNESFMKFGNSWVDIVTMHPNSNICLKAFTDVVGTSQGVLLMGVDNENRTYYSEMAEPVESVELIDVTPQAYKDFFENLESDDEISLFSTDSSEDYGVIPLPFLSGDNGVDVSEGVTLPAEYDLRTFNRVSSVKDQGPLGTCWTFSTYASLESCLKGKTDSVITANGMIFSNSGLIAPESVEINVEEITIAYNGEAYLSADVLPSAADKSVIWSSSDEEVVTVSSNGRINGVSEGVALVFATSKDGSVMDFCTVEVTAPADLESINLSEDNIHIATGDIHLIDYVLYPTNVANQKIVWSTDNGSVASVSEYGVLTGVNDGVAVITASTEDGSCVAKANVTVGDGQNNESSLLFTVANSTSNNNVTVTVSNNTETKQTGVLLFAVYDTQGRLVNLYDEDISLDGLANTSYTYSVVSGMNVKSFVWSSLGNLKPISNVAE